MNILLVDDNKVFALPVIKFLERHDYHVTHVFDGRAALEAYRTSSPDLVLMDVMMPEMNGIEATRQIRALGGSRWIPIIMMTGLSKKGDIVTGLDVGADEYLVKPVDFDILAARMRSVQRIASIQDKLSDRLSLWVTRIATTRHPNVAAVAMANKTVRIAWAIIRKGCDYQPELAAA